MENQIKIDEYCFHVSTHEFATEITFDGECNRIDFTNLNMCVFEHVYEDGSVETLGMTPYENIKFIMKHPKEKE